MLVPIAALSSAISLLEAVVAYLVDDFGFSRVPTAVGLGVTLFLPITVLLVAVFVGWIMGQDAVDELTTGMSGGYMTGSIWLWGLRTIVLLAIIVIVGLNLIDLFLTPNTGYYIIPLPLR